MPGSYQNAGPTTGFGGAVSVSGNVKQFFGTSNQLANGLKYQTIGGTNYQVLADSNTTLYLSNVVINSQYSHSDKNLKNNIIDIPEDKKNSLLDLNPTQFNFKLDTKNNIHYGFIAQDLEKIYPELVKDSEKGHRKVNYMELIPLIISKMKNMQNEINELKTQLQIKNNDV
jgi:hypothetical protein